MKNKIVVLKIGTSSICDDKTFLPKLSKMSLIVETVVSLKEKGYHPIIVSSGAVGVGLRKLSYKEKPKKTSQKQAAAATGQGKLMALYDNLFSQFGIALAQILLTRDNISEKSAYMNACNTIRELIKMGVVPIINENDSVSSPNEKFGDNDSLSAIVAGMMHADYLFLMTDVNGLYTDNPRKNPDAKRIAVVDNLVQMKQMVDVSSAGTSVGTGGMETKLIAADRAISAGCGMFIIEAAHLDKVPSILATHEARKNDVDYEPEYGTYFSPAENKMSDHDWWIYHSKAPAGSIVVDQDTSPMGDKVPLNFSGITGIEGTFNAKDCVILAQRVKEEQPDGSVSHKTVEIGKGIVNYSSAEMHQVIDTKARILDALGYKESDYAISLQNIAYNPSLEQ